MGQTTKTTKICQICGGSSARKAYGAITCGSCRIFFIRTSRRKDQEQIRCDFYNNCMLSTHPRMNCIACRYHKCVQLGMFPAEVGKNKQKAKTFVRYLSSIHYKQIKTELSLYLLPSGLSNISRLQNATTVLDFTEILVNFETLIANLSGKSASEYSININANLIDVLMNPTLCATRESTIWDARTAITLNKRYYYSHTYCRFVTNLADFLSSIPEFHFLGAQDKLKLFQQTFSLNTMATTMYYARFKECYRTIDARKRISRFYLSEKDKEIFYNCLKTATLSFDTTIRPKLEEIQITDQEWILLKIICMFSTVTDFSEEGKRIINSSRLAYCSILGKLISEMHPYYSENEKILRLRKLLNTTGAIIKHVVMTSQVYSAFVAENKANLRGALSYDIHMRRF